MTTQKTAPSLHLPLRYARLGRNGKRLPYWHGRALAAGTRWWRESHQRTRGLYTGPDNRNQPELLQVKRTAGKALEAIHVWRKGPNASCCPGSYTHSPVTAIVRGPGFVAYCPRCDTYQESTPTGYLRRHG